MNTNCIALLGTHTPRQCGIATFTDDLAQALARAEPDAEILVVNVVQAPTAAQVEASMDTEGAGVVEEAPTSSDED